MFVNMDYFACEMELVGLVCFNMYCTVVTPTSAKPVYVSTHAHR